MADEDKHAIFCQDRSFKLKGEVMLLEEAKNVLETANSLAYTGYEMAATNAKFRKTHDEIKSEVDKLQAELESTSQELATMSKAAAILANVSDECTKQILRNITDTINKALAVLFPADPKTIEITKTMYRDTHPHFILTLKTKDNIVRTFNQSGTGLGQIISFLFTTRLIDIKGGRRILVMDELLNGLHPDAKVLVAALMKALSEREKNPFQFVCVEYNMDIGRQYEIKKTASLNGLSLASPWQSEIGYYKAHNK